MEEISIGAGWAWRLAARVATETGWEQIEPAHLWIGLCSLDQVLRPRVLAQLNLNEDDIVALRVERDIIRNLLERFQLDTILLRRLLRQKQGRGQSDQIKSVVRRSPQTREVFAHAERVATEEALGMIDVALLCASLLEDSEGPLGQMLREQGTDITALKREALGVARRPSTRRPWRSREAQREGEASDSMPE